MQIRIFYTAMQYEPKFRSRVMPASPILLKFYCSESTITVRGSQGQVPAYIIYILQARRPDKVMLPGLMFQNFQFQNNR